MAVKRGGLGKGLDSLIAPTANPKIKKHTEEKQDTVKVVEKVVEKIVEKPADLYVKISEVEPNREQPENILMRMRFWNWQILSGNLEFFSLFW